MAELPFQADQHGPVLIHGSRDAPHHIACPPAAIWANKMPDSDPAADERLRLRNNGPTHQQPKSVVDTVRDSVLQFAFMAQRAETPFKQAPQHVWGQDVVGVDDEAYSVDDGVQAAHGVEVTLLERLKFAFGASQAG